MTDETDPGIVVGKSSQMAIQLTRRQNMLLVRSSLKALCEKRSATSTRIAEV